MRTPVVLVCGQGDTDRVAGKLMNAPGTAVAGHEFDGQAVRRWVSVLRDGELSTSEVALELTSGGVFCTTRNDLLVLLRRIQRRDDVKRIVVLLAPWMDPEPVCYASNHVRVRVGPGYIDGPAARDVQIHAVVNCIDTDNWLAQAVGDDELDDERTVAQVVVGQAEFADVAASSGTTGATGPPGTPPPRRRSDHPDPRRHTRSARRTRRPDRHNRGRWLCPNRVRRSNMLETVAAESHSVSSPSALKSLRIMPTFSRCPPAPRA
jgi:CobW/HypB/UreG, nucleotide-binding domain